MAILDQPGSDNPRCYDLSFIYTRHCNLSCSFCMYNSGPDVHDKIDIVKLNKWLQTIDPVLIASLGVYGGEPSTHLAGFSYCLDRAQHFLGKKPCFVITNGSWSTDIYKTIEFLKWCVDHNAFMVVSGTPEHRKFQDRAVIEGMGFAWADHIRLKPKEENFHAMGRLEGKMPFSCSQKCMSWNRALRIAVQPDGNIIFQNCDGVYPVVGNLDEDFGVIDERVQAMRARGFGPVCEHFQQFEKAA